MTEGGEKQYEAKIHKSLITAFMKHICLRVFLKIDLKIIYFCWNKGVVSAFCACLFELPIRQCKTGKMK